MMKPQGSDPNPGHSDLSRRIVCKSCTAKCRMVYDPQSGKLTGNKCPRGEAYAKAYNPDAVKVRTYLIPVENGHMKRMALRTGEPIGEELSDIVEAALKPKVVRAPVEAGATVFSNIGDSGVDLIAVRKMPARTSP